MKRNFFLVIFSIWGLLGYSQTKLVEVSHYLFPKFEKGVVLFKTGIKNEVVLNYNSLTEEMIFESKGTKLAFDNLNLVDTVYISGCKFFPLNNKFVELIYSSQFDLYAESKCSVKEPGKPAPFGGNSQTSSATNYSSFFSNGQAYELNLPDGYETKPFVIYWLKHNGELNKFQNIKQLLKLLNIKDDAAKEYIKKNNVKYENRQSVVSLIRYLLRN